MGPLATLLVGASILAGCASGAAPDGRPAGATALDLADSPWSGRTLRHGEFPEAVLDAWAAAPNRRDCAPMAPAETVPGATARTDESAGGWSVVWDLPGLRDAFAVEGTTESVEEVRKVAWPRRLRWRDGSVADYGPAGEGRPVALAYLTIPGQACLYRVSSALGLEHLEVLLRLLRWVDVTGAAPTPRAWPPADPPGSPGPPGSTLP